jgi:hypothetical protein
MSSISPDGEDVLPITDVSGELLYGVRTKTVAKTSYNGVPLLRAKSTSRAQGSARPETAVWKQMLSRVRHSQDQRDSNSQRDKL